MITLWRKFCRCKIERLMKEQRRIIQYQLKWSMPGSYAYEFDNLAIAMCDLKIEFWIALSGETL